MNKLSQKQTTVKPPEYGEEREFNTKHIQPGTYRYCQFVGSNIVKWVHVSQLGSGQVVEK